MTEVAPAPAEQRREAARPLHRLSPWQLLVTVSLLVLVGGAIALGAGVLASGATETVSYRVPGPLLGVQLRVVSGNVVVFGGGTGAISVRRVDRSTFGRGPVEWRERDDRRLAVSSTCPKLVVGSCSASYRVIVPDNVAVSVRADHGSIRVESYRGSASLATGDGSISVEAFCGHTLRASSVRGAISASSSCAPERLELRSASGDVSATVPQGRYRVEASSGHGEALVRGLTADVGAPWEIQALSTSGDVRVEAGS